MNCFCTPQNNASGDSCCKANDLCSFSGNLDDVTATPIYVQSVYDAVRFHMQGMKTVQNLKFTPAIPPGCSVSRILDIRCKKVFDPSKASDRSNLTRSPFREDTVRRHERMRFDRRRHTDLRHTECQDLGQHHHLHRSCDLRQLRP